jgi:hypothetical protein
MGAIGVLQSQNQTRLQRLHHTTCFTARIERPILSAVPCGFILSPLATGLVFGLQNKIRIIDNDECMTKKQTNSLALSPQANYTD